MAKACCAAPPETEVEYQANTYGGFYWKVTHNGGEMRGYELSFWSAKRRARRALKEMRRAARSSVRVTFR